MKLQLFSDLISTLSCTIPRYDSESARRVLADNDDASDTDAGPSYKEALMLMLSNLRYGSKSPPETSDADTNADVDPGCGLALMLMLALAQIWRPVMLLLMLALSELTLMLIPTLLMMLANLRNVSESASTGGL